MAKIPERDILDVLHEIVEQLILMDEGNLGLRDIRNKIDRLYDELNAYEED